MADDAVEDDLPAGLVPTPVGVVSPLTLHMQPAVTLVGRWTIARWGTGCQSRTPTDILRQPSIPSSIPSLATSRLEMV